MRAVQVLVSLYLGALCLTANADSVEQRKYEWFGVCTRQATVAVGASATEVVELPCADVRMEFDVTILLLDDGREVFGNGAGAIFRVDGLPFDAFGLSRAFLPVAFIDDASLPAIYGPGSLFTMSPGFQMEILPSGWHFVGEWLPLRFLVFEGTTSWFRRIPEPSTLALLSLSMLAALRRSAMR